MAYRFQKTLSLPLRVRVRSGSQGFTAVEIAMVATVIAILSLLIIPTFRSRLNEARAAAVQDELQQLAKAQLLVEADIGQFVRLQDLDNAGELEIAVGANDTGPAERMWNDYPYGFWNGALNVTGSPYAGLSRSRETIPDWNGPYVSFKNFEPVISLLGVYGYDSTQAGFILAFDDIFSPAYTSPFSGASQPETPATLQEDRYPVDPWGSPYIFYGPDIFPATGNTVNESVFNYSVIYSLGPDGLPHTAGTLANKTAFNRFAMESGIGAPGSDDLDIRF